jgi:hypothetical protein
MNKLFIIGLPRTGTTSISVALLDYSFMVAHTAYTKRAFELADVISDTPCFCDYQQLDELFPDSKFVYLDRAQSNWIPSIQMLLKKMQKNLSKGGHFNPIMKRCFNDTFKLLTTDDPFDYDHLSRCYQEHRENVLDYFYKRSDFLKIDVSNAGSLNMVLNFLDIKKQADVEFPHLNVGRMVTSWKELKHPNKINANSAGIEHRKFFDYAK